MIQSTSLLSILLIGCILWSNYITARNTVGAVNENIIIIELLQSPTEKALSDSVHRKEMIQLQHPFPLNQKLLILFASYWILRSFIRYLSQRNNSGLTLLTEFSLRNDRNFLTSILEAKEK